LSRAESFRRKPKLSVAEEVREPKEETNKSAWIGRRQSKEGDWEMGFVVLNKQDGCLEFSKGKDMPVDIRFPIRGDKWQFRPSTEERFQDCLCIIDTSAAGVNDNPQQPPVASEATKAEDTTSTSPDASATSTDTQTKETTQGKVIVEEGSVAKPAAISEVNAQGVCWWLWFSSMAEKEEWLDAITSTTAVSAAT
jgi:hypothetical protein